MAGLGDYEGLDNFLFTQCQKYFQKSNFTVKNSKNLIVIFFDIRNI